MQREIEAAGFATIAFSNIPDLTASARVPRLAAIEFPFGLTMGVPGDADGQRGALQAGLLAMEGMKLPGSRVDLPYSLPQNLEGLNLPPPENPPIATYIVRHPWHVPHFFKREPPVRKA